MEHWAESYCEEENNLLACNVFMLDRFKTQVTSSFTVFRKVYAFCKFRFDL